MLSYQSLKVASLQPRLKKASLDPDEFNSFRPISNLKFISKSIEKIVADQTCQYVKNNNLEELYQSAYRASHSTETALLKVQNDILRALDNKNSVILLLLDLSDTIDHEILLSRLSCRFGIVDKALEWFRSYLTNRTFTVNVSGSKSSTHTLRSGVPQGGVPHVFNGLCTNNMFMVLQVVILWLYMSYKFCVVIYLITKIYLSTKIYFLGGWGGRG